MTKVTAKGERSRTKHQTGKPFVRARIDPIRKMKAEKILEKIGVTPAQAINMLCAQIELRRGLPFSSVIQNEDEIAPIQHVAEEWGRLDDNDYSYLIRK